MSREDVEQALAEAVEVLRTQGDPWWPGEQVAPIAYRRWTTFSRRSKATRVTREHRVRDLVKGLQSHFEPDCPYTHPNDWFALAEVLAKVFDRFSPQP